MAKGVIKNYTFNTVAKTITLTDIATVRLDKLALITDVTTNKILYNFANSSIATATVATNVITLSALQGGEANGDKLRIDYDVESSDTSAFADTTSPVSASSLPLPTGAATAAKQDTGNTSLSSIDGKITAVNTGAVVVSSGSVTANAGTNLNTSALALSATQTDRSQFTKITDGTRDGTVKAASTLPALTDTAIVTTQRDPLPAGTNVIGHVIADSGSTTAVTGTVAVTESGTWTVQPGNTANTTAWLVSQTPATSGGLTIGPASGAKLLSAATTNATLVKGGAGQVYGWAITNTNAAARFVKLYNKATAPTVGTDTPVMTLVIPGSTTGAGMVAAEFTSGIAFGTGIGVGITGAIADNDTTAVAANEVVINLFYK